MRIPRLVLALAVFMLVSIPVNGASSAPTQQEPTSVEVDGAVQVTANPDPARGHSAPALAVHPENDQVLGLAEGDVAQGPCAVHISTNGGLSWRPVTMPDIPDRWDRCTFQNLGPIVDVAFAPDGTLYYAFNGYDSETQEGRIFLARSDNLGSSWTVNDLPRVQRDIEQGEFGIDALPSIAIDPNDPDNVHVAWSANWGSWTLSESVRQGQEYYWDFVIRAYVASSDDGGATFSEPVDVGEDVRVTEDIEGTKTPPQALVGNEGEVYVVFGDEAWAEEPEGDAPPASIHLAVSRDGGETYETDTIYTEPSPEGTGFAWIWPPRAAFDHDSGAFYVVWEQLSNAGQPIAISMIRSTDRGRTWSAPVQVNDVEPPRKSTGMEFMPNVSVAPNGRVDIIWYDARNDPTAATEEGSEDAHGSSQFHDVYYTHSADRGETWAPNVRITDRLIDRSVGPWGVGDIHTVPGIAATSHGAYIAWDDTRNAREETNSQDIYFTRARLTDPEAAFSTAGSVNKDRLLGGALGTGGALLLAGLVLLLAVRSMNRRGSNGDERVTGAAAQTQ